MLRVSVTTYHTVVCLGNVLFDEEFISREAFGIALLKRGFVVVVEVGCRSVMEFTSCRVTWLTRGRRTG